MDSWPKTGAAVVVWLERTPSTNPREPRRGVVDHVAGLTFTVEGVDATFNRSTGRSKPVRRIAGAFGSDTYVAVDARSTRGQEVFSTTARVAAEAAAVTAVQAWLGDRSETNRRAAQDALDELGPPTDASE